MSKPHVAIAIHDFDPTYGQGRYCHELVGRLHPEIRFTILANTYTAEEFPDVRWVRIPVVHRNAYATILSFIRPAEKALQQIRPDLIHAQGLTSWSADIITGHICNRTRLQYPNTRWVRPRLFAHLITPLERAFYRQRRARHLIAISRRLAGDIRDAYGWNRAVSVIYHGTRGDQFQPCTDPAKRIELRRQFSLDPDAWTWLFMGEAVKGLRQAIDQLAFFPGARLLVITRSPMARYKSQARRLGVAHQVHFHGFHDRAEEAFQAADLFIYASDYEPFGMVVTEAMASGLPVAMGRDVGAAELVEDGVSGLLFDPHDPDSIRDRLQWVVDHPREAREMGRRAREIILPHDWDRCAQETLQVYLSEHRNRSVA